MIRKFSSLWVFFIFWLTTFVLYFKTIGAGFVTDQIGWLNSYNSMGWKGIFSAFGDKSLHYIYHLAGFLTWKLFGLNGTGWMLTFISLHAGTAFLSYKTFKILFSKEGIRFNTPIAFAGALLFIVSPYQTEPLVWYACIHYLLCSLLLFSAFLFLLAYLQQNEKKFIAAFYITFFLSLFTLEISFSFPIILLAFFLFWPAGIMGNKPRISLIKTFVAPSFVLLVLYFILSKILRGSAVGHYGTSAHLNFSIPLLLGNLNKYVAKLLLLTQFMDYEIRQRLYLIFERPKFAYCIFALLLFFALVYILLQKRLAPKYRISVLLFAFFVIALLPILNLYFSYVVNVEGDRFTYFASIFAYQFFVLTVVVLLRRPGWLVISIFLFFNFKYLLVNLKSWESNCNIQKSLLANFHWRHAKNIYILNLPDNFNGTYMYRTFAPDNSFAETLDLINKTNIEDNVVQVLSYNMNGINDSVIVEQVTPKELKVTFAQNGNWWWSGGIGAGSYEADSYKVTIDEWSHGYTIAFKDSLPATIIYQCGKDWRQLKKL